MTTILVAEPTRLIDSATGERELTNTYVATLDASVEAACEALRAIDPSASLARRLGALGVNDRAVWLEPSNSNARARGWLLLWRFDPNCGQTAEIAWHARLDEDGAGRTVLTITVRARGSDDHAAQQIALAWPIIETIAHQHAKTWRRSIDDYAEEPW